MEQFILFNLVALIACSILAFVIARFIFREEGFGPILPATFVVLLVTANLIGFFVLGKMQFEAKLLEDPLVEAVKINEPQLYEKLLTTLITQSLEPEKGAELFRSEIEPVIYRRIKNAENDVVSSFADKTIEAIQLLQDRNNGDCFKFLKNSSNSSLKDKNIEQQINFKEVLIELLNDTSTQPDPRQSVAEAQIQAIGQMIYSQFGSDIMLLQKGNLSLSERQTVCKISMNIIKRLNRPYDDDKMEALRFFITQAK